ncbi:MAG: GGDEF domain-containing protein [Candidatus Sphingomonas colombiensis]|nr:GGDEF domain-containing protein [Sphingomonas sp.]WEK44285.1 MAG: GGDEF domain-containing protein [Sphingomonas sp.]
MEFIAARQVQDGSTPLGLFERIGLFLAQHRLSPEPAHYSFSYHVLSDPEGELARAVTALTDGGLRLSRDDIVSLGGEAVTGPAVEWGPDLPRVAPATEQPDPVALIAKTQEQVDDFADTVRAIHVEATDFGRDIAASAAAMRHDTLGEGIDEIARLTGAMLERVRQVEARLEAATRETEELRLALDVARGNARRDPLTDLANRRAFDEAYAALTPGTAAMIAVCDVDHFKRVNDDFGHAVGDRVLKTIGQTLATECEGHLVARLGGEEFGILFVGVELDQARLLIERARSSIAGRRLRLRSTDAFIGAVTISAGLARAFAAERQEAGMARADAALYAAKRGGRNRVEVAPETGE